MKPFRVLLSASLLLAVSGAMSSAMALTTTTTFTVNATVLKNCAVSATNLAFGNYTPGSGNVDSTSTVSVRCTATTGYTVALDKGTTTAGTITQRLLANSTNTLQYNLYTDASRSTLWGDGTTGTTAAGTGTGFAVAQAITVYGRLPDTTANQNAVVGTYTDTITVTVTY